MAKENLTPLKILVFSMGLVLVGGTVLLAGIVWQKISAEKMAAGSTVTAQCSGGNVDLKGRGAIVDSVLEGEVMRVTFAQKDGKQEVVMVDVCSGKIMGTLTLTFDAVTPIP